jgi:hypothetical protein
MLGTIRETPLNPLKVTIKRAFVKKTAFHQCQDSFRLRSCANLPDAAFDDWMLLALRMMSFLSIPEFSVLNSITQCNILSEQNARRRRGVSISRKVKSRLFVPTILCFAS